jgi:hypothetical protein
MRLLAADYVLVRVVEVVVADNAGRGLMPLQQAQTLPREVCQKPAKIVLMH